MQTGYKNQQEYSTQKPPTYGRLFGNNFDWNSLTNLKLISQIYINVLLSLHLKLQKPGTGPA